MNKEQEIEKMIKIMENCLTCNCEDCKYYNSHNDVLQVKAKALYDAGCRIIDKDSRVLTKEEYVQLKKHNADRKRLRTKIARLKGDKKCDNNL